MAVPADRVTENVVEEGQLGKHASQTKTEGTKWVIAQIHASTIRSLRFRPGPATLPLEEASIWYFAFGSNMNEEVLRGRRLVVPAEAVPAKLPGYRLVFDLPGLPYREPAFASLEPINKVPNHHQINPNNGKLESELSPAVNGTGKKEAPLVAHGVTFRITASQWAYICVTEGAAGTHLSDYSIIPVTVEAYDGRLLSAFTLTTSAEAKKRGGGRELHPSLRYLTVIRKGARNHGLDEQYLQYLDTLPAYQPVTLGQKIAQRALLITELGLFSVFNLFRLQRWAMCRLGYCERDSAQRVPVPGVLGPTPLVHLMVRTVLATTWMIHNLVSPFLGSGAT